MATGSVLYTFVETDVFRKRLDELASLDTLFAIQQDLIENPKRGAVIAGTRGLRKSRVADRRNKKGKRGSFRYLYLFLEHVGMIYLIVIFAMKDKVNISPAEIKELGHMVKQIKDIY